MAWACAACTYLHGSDKARFLACDICRTARGPDPCTDELGRRRQQRASSRSSTLLASLSARPYSIFPHEGSRGASSSRQTPTTTRWGRREGHRDRPGIARLSEFHPALDVGNEVAAAAASDAGRAYKVVLSTVTPRRALYDAGEMQWRYDRASDLSTIECKFDDRCGKETPAQENVAREKIVQGAFALHQALLENKLTGEVSGRALVHCSWGQNRSNAICVAYAVAFRGWQPSAAIAYARTECKNQRNYARPNPLGNERFVDILSRMRPSRDGSGALLRPTSAGLDAWLLRGSRGRPESDTVAPQQPPRDSSSLSSPSSKRKRDSDESSSSSPPSSSAEEGRAAVVVAQNSKSLRRSALLS